MFEVLNAVLETTVGFSYGFGPDAARMMRWTRAIGLTRKVGLTRKKVNGALHADIRSYLPISLGSGWCGSWSTGSQINASCG